MIMLRAEKLAVGYGRKKVVDAIDFEVIRGQIVCLLGPNGSGKTTILKTIAGLLRPVNGTILIDGLNANSYDNRTLSKKMGVVLTEKATPGLMTVFEVVSLGRHPYTGFMGKLRKNDIDAINEAILLVHAEDIANRYFHELSDGEMQKTLIARALAQEPDILVLDEPIGHLDVHHRIEVLSILKKLSKEKNITVIMSLHEIDLAIKVSDIVMLLKEGKVVEIGSPEVVIDQNTIRKLYDIKHGNYNHTLSSTDISSLSFLPPIFVLAGSGTGTPVYRMLVKCGFRIYTGVLHQNDIDYWVSDSVGAEKVGERAFELIGEDTKSDAREKMLRSKHIIDSGYPIGQFNWPNIELTIEMINRGRKILSLRNRQENMKLFGNASAHIEHFDSLALLASRLYKD